MPRLVFILATIVLVFAVANAEVNGPPRVEAEDTISIEPFVWQVDEDYPEGTPPDELIPMQTVYLKTHDGTNWMSKWDQSPNSISGLEALRRELAKYQAKDIRVIAWFVPYGTDYQGQLNHALAVLGTGVDGLYADIEPYEGFCFNECAALAENFWKPLRALRPDAHLGVIYDPRPLHRDNSAATAWLSVADAALPMCYWDSFVDQPPWNDPGGCIRSAAADLGAMVGGRPIGYIPIAQGDTSPDKMRAGLQAIHDMGMSQMSLWRRGVVSMEVWSAIGSFRQNLADPKTELPVAADPPVTQGGVAEGAEDSITPLNSWTQRHRFGARP